MAALTQLSRKKAAKHPRMRWDALNEFCTSDHASMTPVQRVAYLAYWYASRVEMAGHHEHFTSIGPSDHEATRAALGTIGATEQASILAAAHDAVMVAAGQAPQEYAHRYLAGVEFADLTEFDEAFGRCERSILACLMDYLDTHEGEFIEWIP